jgi:hypothetical protein
VVKLSSPETTAYYHADRMLEMLAMLKIVKVETFRASYRLLNNKNYFLNFLTKMRNV